MTNDDLRIAADLLEEHGFEQEAKLLRDLAGCFKRVPTVVGELIIPPPTALIHDGMVRILNVADIEIRRFGGAQAEIGLRGRIYSTHQYHSGG